MISVDHHLTTRFMVYVPCNFQIISLPDYLPEAP